MLQWFLYYFKLVCPFFFPVGDLAKLCRARHLLLTPTRELAPYSTMAEKYTIPEVNNNREWFWLTGRKNTHLTKEDEEKIKDKAGSVLKSNF
jgi:hypothetical protein